MKIINSIFFWQDDHCQGAYISEIIKGHLPFVDGIEDSTEKAMAEVALNDTTEWKRSSPFLNAAAQALDIGQEALDDLFIDASKIEL